MNKQYKIWTCHVTDLTIYGNMTSYMIQNWNFELNAMVTVTCDQSNHIWKYCQFTSKTTLNFLTLTYLFFTNHSLSSPWSSPRLPEASTGFTPIPTVVPLASVPDLSYSLQCLTTTWLRVLQFIEESFFIHPGSVVRLIHWLIHSLINIFIRL
jgi:hypothetical protein